MIRKMQNNILHHTLALLQANKTAQLNDASKGVFSGIYMTTGKSNPGPIWIQTVLNENISVIIVYHTHICENRFFYSPHFIASSRQFNSYKAVLLESHFSFA